MKTVKINGSRAKGRELIVDDEDFELVSSYKWYVEIGDSGTYEKVRGRKDGKKVYIGRLILNYNGDDTYHVNHKNHNVFDNRRENLELIHRDENNRFRKKHKRNSTGFKGVTRHSKKKDKFVAQIETRINGSRKTYNLGTFDTAEEAARAYDKKCIELQGRFALTNFPKEEYS